MIQGPQGLLEAAEGAVGVQKVVGQVFGEQYHVAEARGAVGDVAQSRGGAVIA